MLSAPPAPHARPAGLPPARSAARRTGRGKRLLWTSGLAAAVVAAGLVTPLLTAPAAPPSAQPGIEQVRKAQPRPGAPAAGPTTASAPASTTSTTTSTPTSPTSSSATTSPTTPPATTAPAATSTAAATSGSATTTAATGSTTAAPAPTDNPLAGMTFHGENTGAVRAAAQPGRSREDAAALAELASVPTTTWLGAWSGDVTAAVGREITAARAAGAVPVFAIYNIPGRDCGGYSAGGLDSSASYLEWVRAVAAGIGTATAVVVVEPDALAQLCGDPAGRLALLRSAVGVLEQNPGTVTYLDAGNPTWIDAATMAERLRAAGSAEADGFALNVSNFETTASNVTYGQRLSSLLGGAHFVVDTSRSGNGPGTDWCNPPGRALGERPTSLTGQPGVDAYLWIKRPGESDGTCNGGPSAGTFWDSYAIGLVRAAA